MLHAYDVGRAAGFCDVYESLVAEHNFACLVIAVVDSNKSYIASPSTVIRFQLSGDSSALFWLSSTGMFRIWCLIHLVRVPLAFMYRYVQTCGV